MFRPDNKLCWSRYVSDQSGTNSQDIAGEQSSMPYRAPELFDVKTGKTLDEKVDIWVRWLICILAEDSLSAVLFSLLRMDILLSRSTVHQSRWQWVVEGIAIRLATRLAWFH